MLRILLVLLTGIVTSLYLFPFNLPFAAEVNTKMVIATVGLGLFFVDLAKKRTSVVAKDFLIVSILSILISVWALFVITVNDTGDTSFTQYFISVWVWMGAAYTVLWLIRAVHGGLSIELIGHYLIGVCVVQCLLAYLMTLSPAIKSFIDGLMGSAASFMGAAEGRLYGLGAALDPAGLRFSGALVILAYLMNKTGSYENRAAEFLYIFAFIIIAIFGNMIARTTTLGIIISILYWIIVSISRSETNFSTSFLATASLSLLISIVLMVVLYQTNPSFRENFRFGFEGFFALAEKGYWETNSTNILKGMIIWPESLRTWLIGDGFFFNPNIPNIFGQVNTGYYMNTDIGYLRYIYYFGSIGLLGMISVFVYLTVSCCRVFVKDHLLFISLLLLNLAGWLKVSSDIIMVILPFFILACIFMKEQSE